MKVTENKLYCYKMWMFMRGISDTQLGRVIASGTVAFLC